VNERSSDALDWETRATARSISRRFPAVIASLISRFGSSMSTPTRRALRSSGFTSFTSRGSSLYKALRSTGGEAGPVPLRADCALASRARSSTSRTSTTAAADLAGTPAGAPEGAAEASISSSDANVTPHDGHTVVAASTVAPHAGHSNCTTASSANSAPHDGHVFASSSTADPHTGHSNFAASARAAPGPPRPRCAASVFPALLIVSKMSPFTSFPSAIESRRSSRFVFEGIFPGATSRSSSELTSKRLRSVWHDGHRFASASISVSQTGQSFVSPRTVWRHPGREYEF